MQYCQHCGTAVTQEKENLCVCANGHQNWINAIPGATIFIIRDNQVLFGVRTIEPNKGGLDMPGGFLELHESAEQAMVRELKEEAGIEILPSELQYLGTYPSDYGDGRPTLNIVYFIPDYNGADPKFADDMGGVPVWRAMNSLPAADELAFAWHPAALADLHEWWEGQNA